MEFDSLFTAVQGIMKSHQNTTVVHFAKVNIDNDVVSKNIIESLGSLMTELGLKEEHKRKINLLLIVNTDFPSIPTLEDDKNFWHLLGCLPKLSSYLYFKIASELNFHTYIGEVIRMCPEFLSLEILLAVNDFLRFLNPQIAIPFLQSLFVSTFHKIVFLQKNKKSPNIIQRFVKIFNDIMNFNIKDLIASLPWEQEKKYIYFGYCIQMQLNLLTSCIARMKNDFIENNIDIYDFSVEFDYSKWDECKGEINWTNHCLSTLLAKCCDDVMAISVDIYMSWCEEDIKGSVDKTLQTAIREAAYICREQIISILHLEEEIRCMSVLERYLKNIALQPRTEDDEIKIADAETIVINLLNPKRTQVKWLKGLICVHGIFQSTTYMKVIHDNAHLFDLDVAKVLLDSLLDFLSTSQCPRDFFEEAKNFFFSCLRKQPLSLQLNLLAYYFDTRGYISIIQRENFYETLTSTLNKLSAGNENKEEMISEIVTLCFENCEQVVGTLLKECLSSEMKTDLLLELLSQVSPLANAACSPTALSLVSNVTVHLLDSILVSLEKKKDSFIQLVRKLCAMGLLDGNIFFPEHILPRFEESLNENSAQKVTFYLDLFIVYVSQPSPPKNAAALLAFFAKCLDNIRPGISNFSLEQMVATSKTVEIVRRLTHSIVKEKTKEDDEIKWLREMGSKLKPVSRVHLSELWTSWKEEVPLLPEWAQAGLGVGPHLPDLSPFEHRAIVTSILKGLPRLTLSEWLLIGCVDSINTDLLFVTAEVVIECMMVATQVPFLLKNPQIINYMLVNFSQYIWEKAIPKMKKGTGMQNKRIRDRLSQLQEILPEELQKARAPQMKLILQAMSESSNEKYC